MPLDCGGGGEAVADCAATTNSSVGSAVERASRGVASVVVATATKVPDLERVLVAYNAAAVRLAQMIKSEGGWSRWREIHAEKQDSPTLTYARKCSTSPTASAAGRRRRGNREGGGGERDVRRGEWGRMLRAKGKRLFVAYPATAR
jgi:hypothetical protein